MATKEQLSQASIERMRKDENEDYDVIVPRKPRKKCGECGKIFPPGGYRMFSCPHGNGCPMGLGG